jgi:transposase
MDDFSSRVQRTNIGFYISWRSSQFRILMIPSRPHCPRCGSRRLIRYGIVAGQQRWRCKRCRYQFTRLEGHGTPEPTKRAAVSLYGYGLSFNAVADLLGTTAQSVLRWVCGYVDRCCSKPPPGDAVQRVARRRKRQGSPRSPLLIRRRGWSSGIQGRAFG